MLIVTIFALRSSRPTGYGERVSRRAAASSRRLRDCQTSDPCQTGLGSEAERSFLSPRPKPKSFDLHLGGGRCGRAAKLLMQTGLFTSALGLENRRAVYARLGSSPCSGTYAVIQLIAPEP